MSGVFLNRKHILAKNDIIGYQSLYDNSKPSTDITGVKKKF